MKDVNDLLKQGGRAAVREAVNNAKPAAVTGGREQAPAGSSAAQYELGRARPLAAMRRHEENDEAVLIGSRYLCRRGGLLLSGPTGIGKSSLAMQLQISFAAGRQVFGITPRRQLRSLVVQAENDEGDLAEMRDGVVDSLRGLIGEEALDDALGEVIVYDERRLTGFELFARCVRPLCAEHRPDILWIDPAFSYLGADANRAEDVGRFLRNFLNPVLDEFDCAGVVVHHTNKPPSGKEKAEWRAGDFAYLGSGSAEWANWARAVLALRSIGSPTVFELVAGKRGRRLDWTDDLGDPAFARHIAHAREPGTIYWREADPEEVDEAAAAAAPGRKASYGVDDIMDCLNGSPMRTGEWMQAAMDETGMSRPTFHRLRKKAESGGLVLRSRVDEMWRAKA